MSTAPAASPFAAEITRAVSGLNAARGAWREREAGRHDVARFPAPPELARAVEQLAAALYPVRLGGFRGGALREDDFVADALGRAFAILREQVTRELDYWQGWCDAPFDAEQAETIVRLFAAALPEIRALIDSDIEAAFVGDPAARTADEILISYPGALAILHYRIAHQLFALGAAIVARVISELANARTGIDIHPGATIGPRFFIDHGTGVVIGETAIIGANVRLYQHVTLGARSPLGLASVGPRDRLARHPIVEDDVIIYAGATILGRVTIGRGSTIGGNVWLLGDVPPNSVVVQPEAVQLDAATAREVTAELRLARA
ncbi:serine O-acetyltransferase [Sphingomonas naasensis]|uniref:serine O-acetyltransferase n=1 Tax=Sphingomonas naasensis TaxID=1344951 RepID=A0A4S1WRD4_9SPHN|nr:serine O-acetyltransferase EpsC [Sphingomonas naasensis]NIJ18693.1 serine O-acetyltransferase [Sphingomonas naasensis]TGX45931.1 serine acetyltransferase [Sphingomonas naasensis]